jgi:hypothetical protein
MDCGDDLPEARRKLGFELCVPCQQEAEASGKFKKSKMEIYQDISGWQFEGVRTKIIKGG